MIIRWTYIDQSEGRWPQLKKYLLWKQFAFKSIPFHVRIDNIIYKYIYMYIISSIVYNSYAISHLVTIIIIIIIIIIQSPRIYYTNIFTTQYNFTYTHCNFCPPYTFTNQILTHSPQLAAMIICPIVNERIYCNKCIHFRNPKSL